MESTQQIVEEVLKELARWAEGKPQKEKGRILFYCPSCTRTYSASRSTARRWLVPPGCLKCGVMVVKYDEEKFSKRRQELAEKAKRILPRLIEIFVKAAEIYTKWPSPSWRLEDGHFTFKPSNDPTEFVYDFAYDVIHLLFFYFDLPQYREAADYLVAEIKRMGLRVLLDIYPPHTDPRLLPPNAKFDVERARYVVEL
jgi:competence CoiA-like predicted nuclease